MSIERDQDFEQLEDIAAMMAENLGIEFENGKYVYYGLDPRTAFAVVYIGGAWAGWQAKAKAALETQQALNDRLLVKSIREHVESHIAEISVNDLFDRGWLAAMKCIQNNIDMLEAQEPK